MLGNNQNRPQSASLASASVPRKPASTPPVVPSYPKRPAPATMQDRFNEWMLEYRFIFVIPFLLPASFLFSFYWQTRDWLNRSLGSYFRTHARNVKQIQDQILKWKLSGSENLLCTARPTFLSVGLRNQDYKKPDNSIVLRLYDIIGLDEKKRTVTVEPGVSVGQLTHFLNPRGWTLPVVPELDDLTFGGLMNGYGIESTSHKYGLLNDIVVSAEVILGDASVVTCSATENADLFRALPWSHGSLGFLVSLEIQIIPCSKYIRLEYEPVYSCDDLVDRFTELSTATNPHEFVEAVQYDFNRSVVMNGDFADEIKSDGVYNPIGNFYKPWFHRHAYKCLESGKKMVEYIPIRDYYHRHTKSIFWEMELILPMGNHWLFRYLLGWLMPPSIAFLKGTQPKHIREHYQDMHIAQDYLVPISEMKAGIEVSHELYDIYPLWHCPHAVFKTEPQGAIRAPSDGSECEMYVDIGIWYSPGPWIRGEFFDGRAATRKFEQWLRDNRGYQATYSVSEQTEDEYYTMFDPTLYRSVREKYKANGVFMDSYDKVHGRKATKRSTTKKAVKKNQ